MKRFLVFAASVLCLSAAAAAPAMAQAGPGYGGQATLTLIPSTVVSGQKFTACVSGFPPNTTATLTGQGLSGSSSIPVGTNGSGCLDPVVTAAPGQYTLTATDGGTSASAVLTIVAGGAAAPSGPSVSGAAGAPSAGAGGLAFTGTEIGLLTGGAALLLMAGGLIVLATRKRRQTV